MSPSNPSNEPTMEEILASIRKIISEDQSEPMARTPEPPLAVSPVAAAAAPVVPPPVPAAPQPGLPPASAPEAHESSFAALEDETPETYAEEASMDDDIISASTRDALDRALEHLDEAPAAPIASRSTVAEGGSIEAIFARAIQESFEPTLQAWVDDHRAELVNRLSPIIREWMDENLPPLIEAAVQKEIARAVRSRKR
jgi:cell pole-organizing protein PopZ